MESLDADPIRMKQAGEELKLLAKKYNKTILSFRTSMNGMDCWAGMDADKYKADVLKNCDVYDQIGDILYQYANFFVKEADRLEKFAKENPI